MIAGGIYFEKSILGRQMSKIVVLQLMHFWWVCEKREAAILSQELWDRNLLILKIQDKDERQQQMKW